MDDFSYIVHIIGLPGAGKTTLSKKLARKLKFSVYRIGEYRSKFPMTIYGEADAWKDQYEFIRKMFKPIKAEPANIKIDTSDLTPSEVYKLVLKKLNLIFPEPLSF